MKVISIITRGRSGALFFQSLLDSHQNISTIPGPFIADYFQWYEKNKKLNLEILINQFIEDHYPIFDDKCGAFEKVGFNKMGKKRNESLKVGKKKFVKHFLNFFKKKNEVSRKSFFTNLHLSYSLTIGHDIKKINTILYYLHDYDSTKVELLQSDFPKTKFVHMVRESVQTIVSLINNSYTPDMLTIKRDYVVRNAFDLILQHMSPLAEEKKSVFLRLEDLHLNPESTMKKICIFLDISWNETLLKSTFNNKVWWNYSNSPTVSGFNKSIVNNRKYKILSNFNAKVLSSLFANMNKIFKYEDKLKKYNLFLAIFLMIIIPFRFEILGFRSANKKIKDIFFILREYYQLRRLIIRIILRSYNFEKGERFPYVTKIKLKKFLSTD